MIRTLWDFSARLYAETGISSACLRLQDEHGIDVNLLMFAAWLGQVHGLSLDAAGVQAAVDATADWQSEVVMPIRALRRGLKGVAQRIADPDVEAVRSRIQALELDAEQREQGRLEALRTRLPAARAEAAGSVLALANIAILIVCRAQPGGAAASRELGVFRSALESPGLGPPR
ncbi:TIGR02444 family protein [Variovorax sp. PBL-E5]|uniref:TIGR02444 family protein n=1 Tax=Variovorax sp. PBL-E5 TaxID=434014 RepID=UPI001318204B|nr:TIGR02444 family protein [Variovorax sp. PBL-E5]VTU19447.1 hypothetical protein E5CHR_00788 [Variovorax sp. PBL-E5]